MECHKFELESGVEDLRHFSNSTLARDFERIILDWINDLHLLLEDPDRDASQKDTERWRGSIESLRNIISLPEILISSLEGDKHE